MLHLHHMALRHLVPNDSISRSRTHRRIHTAAFLKDVFSFRGNSQPKPEQKYMPDESAKPFQQWLSEHGGKLIGLDKVHVCQCGAQGRGLVAMQDIRRGERILQVPGSLVITGEAALAASSLSAAGLGQLGEYTVIAACLAELRYWAVRGGSPASSSSATSQAAKAEALRLQPYHVLLPERTGCVLEWPETSIQALPACSHVRQQALRMREAAKLTWAELQPVVQRAEQAGAIPPAVVTQESMRWALSTMLARAVRLTARGGLLALVPWADFLNHSPASSAHLDWEQGPGSEGGVTLVADRAYKAGEQIVISYGQRSSSELLLSYGFSPDPTTHPHETLPLVIGLQPGDPLKDAKAVALTQAGLPTSCAFPLRIDALPAGLISYAAFCAARAAQGSTGKQARSRRAVHTAPPGGISDVRSLLFQVLPGAAEPATWTGSTATQSTSEQQYGPANEAAAARVAACAQQATLPADLEAAGLREVASTCATLLKSYPAATAGASPPTSPSVRDGQQTLDGMLAGIAAQERRILARTEFMCSSKARALAAQ